MFENAVPRVIFGCVREEITGDWRKLQNEEFYEPNVYWTAHNCNT